MRARSIVAAVAPLLLAVTPLAGQQKPAPPSTAAPTAAKPGPTAKPASAPVPTPIPARIAAPVPAPRIQLEVAGGIGTTVVNMDTWSGNTANDWGTMAYWGAARVLFPLGTSLRVGVEAGYHYHFWYKTSTGLSWNYNYDVTATHVAGLVRLPLGGALAADLGGGMHFFNNAGSHPGALAALTYSIPIGTSLVLPVGVRADAIFVDPMIVPVVFSAGLRFTL